MHIPAVGPQDEGSERDDAAGRRSASGPSIGRATIEAGFLRRPRYSVR